MKYGTKEFIESQREFEKIAISEFGLNITKEDKEDIEQHIKNGHLIIYANGNTNNMFIMFLMGVEIGKFIW